MADLSRPRGARALAPRPSRAPVSSTRPATQACSRRVHKKITLACMVSTQRPEWHHTLSQRTRQSLDCGCLGEITLLMRLSPSELQNPQGKGTKGCPRGLGSGAESWCSAMGMTHAELVLASVLAANTESMRMVAGYRLDAANSPRPLRKPPIVYEGWSKS